MGGLLLKINYVLYFRELFYLTGGTGHTEQYIGSMTVDECFECVFEEVCLLVTLSLFFQGGVLPCLNVKFFPIMYIFVFLI